MVVVDKLRKATHFISSRLTVILDRDVKLTSTFWKALFEGFDRHPSFSIAYHPQTDRQIEMTIQILKSMFRFSVMHVSSEWEDNLHLVEFS